jgi:hypothetical protein
MTRKSTATFPKQKARPVAVYLRPGALDRLFTDDGPKGYERRAAALGCSMASLFRADKGLPVGVGVIAAIRNLFPTVAYESSFTEGAAPDVQAKNVAA